MSGRGKGTRAPSKISKSKKAGLAFPVSRVGRYLRDGRYSRRLALSAPIYLAAVLEYLCAELLELSGKAAKDNNRKQSGLRALSLALNCLQDHTTAYSDGDSRRRRTGQVVDACDHQRWRCDLSSASGIAAKEKVKSEDMCFKRLWQQIQRVCCNL